MRTATTKIRVDSRVVRVAIDANASASAVLKLDRHVAAALSFGGLLDEDATAHCFSLGLFAFLDDKKFNQMLKPAEELHVSCLMFRILGGSSRRENSRSVYTQPWAGVDLSSLRVRCCRTFLIALSGVRSKFAQLHPVLELRERRCTCCRGSG